MRNFVCVRACVRAREHNRPCADRRCCWWCLPVSRPSRYQPNLYLTRYLPALRTGPELYLLCVALFGICYFECSRKPLRWSLLLCCLYKHFTDCTTRWGGPEYSAVPLSWNMRGLEVGEDEGKGVWGLYLFMARDFSEQYQSQIHRPLEHRSRHRHSDVNDKWFCTDSSCWVKYPLRANSHSMLTSKISSYQNWTVERYSSTLSLTSEQNGGWVVNARLRPLYPRERPGIHCTGGWVGPRAGLVGAENLVPPPGCDPLTVQSVASRVRPPSACSAATGCNTGEMWGLLCPDGC